MLPNECVRYRVQKINMRSEWRSSPTILRTSCVMVTLISSCVSCVYDEYVDDKEYSYYDGEGDHAGPPPASRNASQEPTKPVAEELHELKHLTKNLLYKVNANRENLKALNARINNMEKKAKSK